MLYSMELVLALQKIEMSMYFEWNGTMRVLPHSNKTRNKSIP